MLSVSMSLPSIINGFSALSTGISAISKSIEGGFIPTLLASVFGLKATEGQTIRQVVTNKLLGESYAGAATNVELFNAALKAMSEYVRDNAIDLSDYFTLNVFFTDDGTIAFTENSDTNCGSQFHLALYRMGKLRTLPDKYTKMLFVYIEELAHYFLRISDETIIKYRVADILRYVLPNFTDEEMKSWGLNGLQTNSK